MSREGRDSGARRMAQAALDRIEVLRAESGGGTVDPHTHDISDVSGLSTALSGKQPVGSYSLTSHNHSGVYSPVGHGHVIADVTGLQAELDAKQAAGSYSLTSHDHAGVYAVVAHDHAGVYAPAAHGHAIADVTGLQTALDGKQASGSYSLTSHNHSGVYAPVSHSHVIADVTGLQTALDGKQAAGSYSLTSHNHSGVYLPMGGGTLTGPLTVGGNIVGADITATRGDGTGVVYLNGAHTRYLYYDGSQYSLASGDLWLSAGYSLKVGGNQVVGARQAAIAGPAGAATGVDTEARTAINAILAAMRTHGLIAT